MAIGKDIKDLYDLLVKQELTDKSFDEFKSAVENEQYRDKVYEVLVNRNLYEGEKAEFDDNYFFEYTPAATQKKKDVSDGTSPTDDTDSMSDPRDLSGSSESSLNQNEVDPRVNNEVDPRVNLDNPFASATGGLPPVPEELKQPSGVRYGANVQKGEKNTWIEEMLGKNTVTDFFGDMWRAANQGMSQGGTVDDALNIYMQGSSVSEDDLQEYITAVEQMESMPMSDEMKSFNEIYDKNGGGILGFMLGVVSNPTVVNQLLISSVASMVNPAVLAGAGSGAAAGAAIGATGFSAGPLGVLTTGGGAITGTLAGAGATLETGLSFTEFLKEEVQKKGLNFDEEGIRQTLNDEDALQRIRNKSAARGLVIGAIDGITRGAAGQIAGKSVKAAKAAGKTVTRAMKAKAALGAAGIEAIGGSTGEAAARAVTGQEMDVADIGFEGITGQATSVLSIPTAVTGKTTIEMLGGEKGAKVQGQIDALKSELQLGNIVQKGINVFKPPKYGIKSKGGIVTPLTKQGILDFVSTATPSQIREMQFEIKNDPELQAIVTAKKERSQIDVMIPDFIQGEDRTKMIALETEKSNLGDTKLDVNKKREADINEQLRQITAKYDGVISESVSVTDDKGNTKKNLIVVTKDFAIQQLEADGITDPTEEQISSKQTELFEQAKKDVSESGNFVRNQAVNQLASDGIVNPTEEQIIEKINAIQESSTEAVDVQESTQDGQEVGVGDSQLTQPSQQSQETQIQDGSETGIRTQTQEEISVNVAPFFETSVESTTEAMGLRKSPQYQQYKQSLIDIANDLGVEVEVDESVGGYVNEAGTKVREVSNVVKLKNATLDQASQYAAITAALAPEVQESSIAAEYTIDGEANHNGNELTIKVSDSEGTFQALKEAGIDEYTLNETNNSLTLLDIFDFSDPEADAKLDALIDILDSKNITYEITDKKAINSRFIGKESRQQILSDGRQSAIQQQQEGSSLYKKILAAINRDAQSRGISPNEYIKSDAAKQKVTADPQRVKKIAQEIKKKIESRRPKKMNPTKLRKQIFDSVIEYASQTKLAEQLNDVQFDALIRELTAEFGLKAPTRASMTKAFKLAQKNNPKLAAIDKAPNVKKKAKRVVVNEMTALKDQIRMQAKAAKQSVKAYKKFLQNITAEVKSLKKTGKISPTQAALLVDRLAKVSPFSQASVDTYLKTVDKVFTKADFVAKMQKAKSLKTKAKKNIKAGKLGVTEGDLKTAIQEVIGFNPYTIPDAQLDSYLSLMEELGASKEVLDLKQKSETLEQALEIINAVAAEVDVNDNLTLTSEKETAEDYNLDANVDIAKDIEITQEQIDNISDPNSKEVARKISELSKQEIAELAREKKDGTMDYSAIETLKKVKQNIQNGYLPRAAMKIVQRVNANNSLKAVNKVFDTKVTKRNVVRHLKNTYKKIKSMITKRTVLDERVRSGPLFYIDDVLGNFNSKTVYDNTFGRLTKAYETFTGKTNQEVAKIEDADKILESDGVVKIRKWFGMGRSRNAVAKSKIKITLLQLQREYLSNFKDGKPNKKTPSANEFVRETLKAAKADDVIGDTQAKFIKEISEKFTGEDGQIDLNKIEKSLTKGEKKYLALIDEVNGGLGQKALFISTMHGNQVDLINNYVHHAVLSNPNKQNNVSAVEAEQKRFSESVNGKTKSITIEERTPGAKPISFNPSYSAKRGLRATNMDYYMTQTLKEVAEVVGRLKDEKVENPSAPKIQVEAAKALQNAFNEVNKNIYMNSFVEVSGGGKLLQRSIRLGYQAALSSITRAGAELVGNVLFAIQNPVTTMQALKKYGPMVINPKYNAMGHDAMVNLGSGQTSKNYDADVLNGKYGAGVQASSPVRSGGEAVNPVFNIMSQIYKFSGIGQYANVVNKIANKTLSLPDQMISRPLWFNNYTNAFAKATKAMGKEIVLTKKDFKAIAEGTSEYLSPEFAEARAEALKVADNANVVQSTSNNPYDGILKNMVSPEDSGRTKLFKTLNGFMARYSLFEFGNANHAIMAMFNKGDINKAQAGAMLAGTITRMGSYMVAYTLLSQLFDDELFDAKDRYEEEDEFEDLLARQMIGSVSSLMFGTNLGNFARIPVNFALEYGINEPLLGDFRKGEYDPFIHSMVFSMINMEDIQKGDPLEVALKIGAGPLGPAINTLRRLGVVTQRIGTSRKPETKKKYKKELEERMVVEVMGNLGLLPFYKDWRRIILKQMFGNELNAEDKKKRALYKKRNPELFKKPEKKKREPRRRSGREPQQRTQRTRRRRNRRTRD